MNFKLSFVIALLFHILLLLIMVGYFSVASPAKSIIHAYVLPRSWVPQKNMGTQLKNQMQSASQPILSIAHGSQSSVSSVSVSSQAAGASISPPPPIMRLLHNKIQQALRYPLSAKLFGEQGTVKVGFVMHPDGAIVEPVLIKTSGDDDLDNAALQTLQIISPVPEVHQYITQPQNFVINIQYYS